MKKLEEINTLLKKLEELTGNADFENAENLGNEEYSEYCKIRNSLIGTIVQVVKAEKKAFDYAEVENTFGNQEFWEQIKESVERDTDIFLKMEILRKLDLKSRKKHYLEIFSVIYDEHEDVDYACRKLKLSKELTLMIFKVMNLCENCIISRFFSKRRIGVLLNDTFGLESPDIEFLWDLFKENETRLEKIAFSNRLGGIEIRITKMNSKIDEIQEEVDWISAIMCEFDETEE